MKTDSFVGIISLISGLVSLGLTIYFTNNLPLQVGSAVTLLLSSIAFFGYITYDKTEQLERKYVKVQAELQQFKDKIDIYSRLAALEHKKIKRETT